VLEALIDDVLLADDYDAFDVRLTAVENQQE
jgi:hypothetical protein